MGMAKRMLAVDKHLATVAWLLRDDRMVHMMPLFFPDQDSKRLLMRGLADLVERANANGVLLIAESWQALPELGEDLTDPTTRRASERPNRSEAIFVIGMTRDGRVAQCTTSLFRSIDGKISFGPSLVVHGGSVNMMRPIVSRWEQMSVRGSKQ